MAPDTKDRTVIETLLPSQMERMTVVDNETNGSRNYRRWFLVLLGGVIVCLAVAAGLICFLLLGKQDPAPSGEINGLHGQKSGSAMTTTSICSSGT